MNDTDQGAGGPPDDDNSSGDDNAPAPSRPRPGNPRDRARDEIVADLDARLRRTQGRLDEVADLLAQVLPKVDDSLGGLAEIRDRLNAPPAAGGADGDGQEAPTNPPVHWPALTVDEAAAAWDQLGQWVAEIFVPYYEITRRSLPDCWPLHRPAVLELSWLRSCYVDAVASDARPQLLAEWNSRWRRDALTHIAEIIDSDRCNPGAHRAHGAGYDEKDPHFTPSLPRPTGRTGPDGDPVYNHGSDRELAWVQNWRPNFDTAMGLDLAARRRAQTPPAQ